MSISSAPTLRRALAVACSAVIAAPLLSFTPAGAAGSTTIEDLISSSTSAPTQGPHAKTKSTPQGQPAARTPNSSSSDHANGAISRSVRIADVSNPTQSWVRHADVVQDLAGQRLRATITLNGSLPAGDAIAVVYFGEFSGSTCRPGAGIAGMVKAADSGGTLLPGGQAFSVSRSRSGSVLTLTSQARSTFRTAAWDCAYLVVARPDTNPAQILQAFYAESLTTHWTPKLSIDGGEPLQAARKGEWVKMRLEVRNGGRSDAKNVRITAAGKGLKVKPRSRSLGTISDRSTKYGVTFKVRVKKGKKARKLKYTVTASGARAAKQFTIGVAPEPKKYKKLSGRYFWGFASSTLSDSQGWDTEVMWFLNKKWVHIGAPKNGVTPKCRKTSKTCVKYTYNRKKGIARIGGKKVKVNSYGFSYKARKSPKRFYEPATFPKKNARIGTDLINQDWSGHCVLMCTATTTNLTLDRKGRFVRGSWSVGSWPGLGSSWSSIPPDQRGTYRIISKGRIQLRFTNGKTERTRIALLHNALNRPSATTGLVLGAKNFYFQD